MSRMSLDKTKSESVLFREHNNTCNLYQPFSILQNSIELNLELKLELNLRLEMVSLL